MTKDDIRPISFNDYIGQENLKQTLKIKIASARKRGEPLDHMLFAGPPGSGKTSLANVIAYEMDTKFMSLIMPMKKGFLPKLVAGFSGVVLFDEIHRLSVKEQEELLPLIEDGYIQLSSGQTIEAEHLTILGATTELDKIIAPLEQRFFRPSIEPYSIAELAQIAYNMGMKNGIVLSDDAAEAYAKASAGTPRNIKNFVYMHRDLWYANNVEPTWFDVLRACRVTLDGLNEDHMNYLRTLRKLGGLAGIDLIASQMQLNKSTVAILEKHLIANEYIAPTKSGRELLGKGYLKDDII